MAQTMTPSPITNKQIEKAVAVLRAALINKRGEFDSQAVQIALGTKNLGMHLLVPFRELVELHSDRIMRTVFVPARSFQSAIDSTGRVQDIGTSEIMERFPDEIEGVERVVIFVKPPESWCDNEAINPKQLAEFFETMGFEPDPHGAVAVLEDDPAFADKIPHAAQLHDEQNGYYYVLFRRWSNTRKVEVRQHPVRWSTHCWFAVRHKPGSETVAPAEAAAEVVEPDSDALPYDV